MSEVKVVVGLALNDADLAVLLGRLLSEEAQHDAQQIGDALWPPDCGIVGHLLLVDLREVLDSGRQLRIGDANAGEVLAPAALACSRTARRHPSGAAP